MKQNEFKHIKSNIEKLDRQKLEELVLAYSTSHARICEISENRTHQEHEEEPHGHATEEEMRKRIEIKSKEELVDLLTGAAAVSEAARP